MKKKILSCLLGSMMVLSLAACNKKEDVTVVDVDYKELMTLGEYKGIEAEVTTSLEVTEQDIQNEIDLTLQLYSETEQVTEGTVKDGDTVNMDYSGLLDGVAFSGGTATDTTYTVGGNFIEDLDRGLIGLEIGKEYEIPCTFPADYHEETLKGKDVIFVVTVNYVEKYVTPEFNDEFVKEITAESEQVLNTTEEMKESIRTYLATEKQSQYDSEVYGQVIQKVIEASEYKSLPQAELDEAYTLITQSAEADFQAYGEAYGVSTFEEFLTLAGYESVEAYEEEMYLYAEDYIREKMAVTLIAEAEGVVVTEEDVEAYASDLATSVGYATVEEFRATYGDTLDEDIRYELIYQNVYSTLISNAVIKTAAAQ